MIRINNKKSIVVLKKVWCKEFSIINKATLCRYNDCSFLQEKIFLFPIEYPHISIPLCVFIVIMIFSLFT